MACQHQQQREDGELIDLRTPNYTAASLYDICCNDITGKHICFMQYKGKVLLIVNIATQASVSSQALASKTFNELNELYIKYHEEGLEILAFPCNQFAAQEPRSNEKIEQACRTYHKARFTLFEKIEVNGPKESPLYTYLKDKKGHGIPIRWNFTKFLVDRTGKITGRYLPSVLPYKIEEDVQSLVDTTKCFNS